MTLEERFHSLSKHGWTVTISVCGDENALLFDASMWRGDSNCPHRGGYNQKSGHGFDHFDSEDRFLIGTEYEKSINRKLYAAIGLERETNIDSFDVLLSVLEKAAVELDKRPKAA